MSKFPQSLCELPVCTGIVCLSPNVHWCLCWRPGVLRQTEMSCVKLWFHFPPALSHSADPVPCAFSARLCSQARQNGCKHVTKPVRGRTQPLRILNPAALGNFWRDTDVRGRQGNSVEGGNKKDLEAKIEASWILIERVTRRFMALVCSALIETMRLQYSLSYLFLDLQVITWKSCLYNFCKQDQILESYPIKVSCFKEFYKLIW